jgi:hypothetical protein
MQHNHIGEAGKLRYDRQPCRCWCGLACAWQCSHCMRLQGQPFVIGLAWWPGGTEEDWGPGNPATTGLQLCNATVQAQLVRGIAQSSIHRHAGRAACRPRHAALTATATKPPIQLLAVVPPSPLGVSAQRAQLQAHCTALQHPQRCRHPGVHVGLPHAGAGRRAFLNV